MKKFPLVIEHRRMGKIEALFVIKSNKQQDSYTLSHIGQSDSYIKRTGKASEMLIKTKSPELLFNMNHPKDAPYPKPTLNVIEGASWDQIKPLLEEVKKVGIKEKGK
jgi:hypothetical protein